MISGIEFGPPKKIRHRILFEAFSKIHPAMFGQVQVEIDVATEGRITWPRRDK